MLVNQKNHLKITQDIGFGQIVDFMIVEGINYSGGVSPKEVIKWAMKQAEDGRYKGFETAFSIVLAIQKTIPFVGGEPDDELVLSQIVDEGYSMEDLFFYYFVPHSGCH